MNNCYLNKDVTLKEDERLKEIEPMNKLLKDFDVAKEILQNKKIKMAYDILSCINNTKGEN